MTRRPAGKRGTVSLDFHKSSAYFGGVPHHLLLPAVHAAGSPSQWNHTRQALGVPARFAAEVEARLISEGFTVASTLPGVAS